LKHVLESRLVGQHTNLNGVIGAIRVRRQDHRTCVVDCSDIGDQVCRRRCVACCIVKRQREVIQGGVDAEHNSGIETRADGEVKIDGDAVALRHSRRRCDGQNERIGDETGSRISIAAPVVLNGHIGATHPVSLKELVASAILPVVSKLKVSQRVVPQLVERDDFETARPRNSEVRDGVARHTSVELYAVGTHNAGVCARERQRDWWWYVREYPQKTNAVIRTRNTESGNNL